MAYYFAKTLEAPFDRTVEKIIAAREQHGFGVVTKIDVQSTQKEKIGADFRPYLILGAGNPQMAHQILQAKDKIRRMLPCNVIVQEVNGKSEVAAIDSVASMQALENIRLRRSRPKFAKNSSLRFSRSNISRR
jgi:uncharacterized protein (DUF302 family)